MLGLTLREEFRGKRLKGTAIELSNDSHTGATQIAAKQFLEITYPTHDLLKGIEAVGPNQGQPLVVIGERGLPEGREADGLSPCPEGGDSRFQARWNMALSPFRAGPLDRREHKREEVGGSVNMGQNHAWRLTRWAAHDSVKSLASSDHQGQLT